MNNPPADAMSVNTVINASLNQQAEPQDAVERDFLLKAFFKGIR
jgi:hypothetical protein